MERQRSARALGWLCAMLLAAIWFSPASAENLGPGGGSRIIVGDEVTGAYRLLVTVSPEPAQTGAITFVVRITDPATGDKVRDADVQIELTHGETGARLVQAATHLDAGSPVDYVAHLAVKQAGLWNGKITITGRAGRSDVAFTQRVLTPRRLSTAVMVGLPFLIVLGVLAGFWYFRTGNRPLPRK